MPDNYIPKVYLASPFFTKEQLEFVDKLEKIIEKVGYRLFSPRKGKNAIEMNSMILSRRRYEAVTRDQIKLGVVTAAAYDEGPLVPSHELRLRVFTDNCVNVDDADLMVAVIDNFDVGVMFEVGYSFARHVPIVTITNNEYGCNLMLAHSIIGHFKSTEKLEEALIVGFPRLAFDTNMKEYATAIAEIQYKFKSDISLREGPEERS